MVKILLESLILSSELFSLFRNILKRARNCVFFSLLLVIKMINVFITITKCHIQVSIISSELIELILKGSNISVLGS